MSDAPAGPEAGTTLLRLTGNDALPLLHRISTASLADLAPGRARATLFCDFRGRLQHRAIVAVTSDGTAWLLRDDAPGAGLLTFIDRSVFRDDVRVTDAGAGRRVQAVPGGAGLVPGTLREEDGLPRRVRADEDWALAIEDGPALPLDAVGEAARIAAGRPRHGHEIAEAFTPFEVGLAHEVHLAKGCYTGQEALLRLTTYRSVRRTLALLEGEGGAPPVPRDLLRAGERCGRLTSACAHGDGWIGLGVVALAVASSGGVIELDGHGDARLLRPMPERAPLGLPAA